MTSTSTWRSPLSILIGARRNDDADLELRDDYFRSPPSPQAAAGTAAAPAPKPPTTVDENAEQPKSGLSSYNPFSYFGLTSAARPVAVANDDDGPKTQTPNNANGTENGSPAHPPLGAFPPPLNWTEAATEQNEIAHDGVDDFIDDREQQQQDANHQFVPSHPWFNQPTLVESSNQHNSNTNPPNDAQPRSAAKKNYITWEDQKAIIGTTFNFANSIIGAGAMGLGGAFAASGGGISVLCLLGFAYLTKSSLDLVVDLSSCPSVVLKARSNENDRDRNNADDSIGSSFSSSESLSAELDSGEIGSHALSVHESDVSNELEALQENEASGIDNDGEGGSNIDDVDNLNQVGSPVKDETTKDVPIAGHDSPQQSLKEDSSPLMAQEEGGNEDGDMIQTPTKSDGLGIDHPLMQEANTEKLKEKDRYDSLIMDEPQPKYFSPLDVNEDGIPVVKSSPPVQNDDNPTQQIQCAMSPVTYEELGRVAYGTAGRLAVLFSKALYSFGCLVAYIVVIRDNFGFALRRIVGEPSSSPNTSEGDVSHGWLDDDDFLAFWVSAIFVLPLSCPRTMKPLAKFSFISVLSIIFLVVVVMYLFFTCTNPEGGVAGKASFYENWVQIRSFSGLIQSLGCFIFTFVCHHTVNLAYESLPPTIRTPKIWRRVSTNSIALALEASLAIGVFAYLTFGSRTPADVLMGYPSDLTLANIARLLLCLTMVLTFPLPLLTCREMSILICIDMHKFYYVHDLERFNICLPLWGCASAVSSTCKPIWRREKNQQFVQNGLANEADEVDIVQVQHRSFFRRWRWTRTGLANGLGFIEDNEEWLDEMNGGDATQALLSKEEKSIVIGGELGKEINPSPLSSRSGDLSSSETTISSVKIPTPSWILPNGDGRQLTLLWHAALTFTIWMVVTVSAIKSPSLGDVLDLVGAFTGTMLAFILPALFSFKLKGYSHLSIAILVIGGVVGLLGTIFSFIKFIDDI